MPLRWKLIRLAGLAGVAATGAVAVRKHRAQHDYEPDELRDRLRRRLAEVSPHGDDRGPTLYPPGQSARIPYPTAQSGVPDPTLGHDGSH